jgi:hypothetical protein
VKCGNPDCQNSHGPYLYASLRDDRTETVNVNSMLDYYFNPFLTGMGMWQLWLEMYNEFAAIGIRLSLNWFDLWILLIPTTAAD